MQADQIPPLLLQRLGLRIGPHMAQYISESFHGAPPAPPAPLAPLSIIAGDARTGVATQRLLHPDDLQPQAPRP